ncbi:MAG: FISUMP domain-containing protein [Flavobacteriales bacterium]
MKYIVINKARWIIAMAVLHIAHPTDVVSQETNHTCGAASIHNGAITYDEITDIDGNSYKTVVIDDKIWFAENLKVGRFQNGELIPAVSDSAEWSGLNGPGLCSYQNDPTYDCPYGKLYNFFVAQDTRNPCPVGWRVPTLTDLYDLIFFLDPNADPQQPGNTPNTAGGPLKSTGLTYWRPPNTNATNLSGFSAIPNGGRNPQGQFSLSYDAAASYWLSTEVGPGMGFFLELAYPQDMAVRNAYWANYGCCLRCVSDLNANGVDPLQGFKHRVYPNPAGDFIRIHSEELTAGQEYILTDLTGAIVLSGRIQGQSTVVSIAELPSGMYFMRFPFAGGDAIKIIKQ